MPSITVFAQNIDYISTVGGFRPKSLSEAATRDGWVVHEKKFSNGFFGSLIKALSLPKADFVFVSFGPFFPNIIWLPVLRLKAKHVICDFRDSWSPNILRNYGMSDAALGFRRKILYRVSLSFEKWALRWADLFLVPTPLMAEYYSDFSLRYKSKVRLVTNGYAHNVKTEVRRESGPKRYVCIGKFSEYGDRAVKNVMAKLESIHEDTPFELNIIGSDPKLNLETFKKVGFSNIDRVHFFPTMKYIEAIEFAKEMDCGVVVVRHKKYELGTKIYDYIGLGLPILDVFDEDSDIKALFRSQIQPDSDGNYLYIQDGGVFHRDHVWHIFLKDLEKGFPV